MFDLIGKAIRVWPHIEALLGLWAQAAPHIAAILTEFIPVIEKIQETKDDAIDRGAEDGQATKIAAKVVLLPGALTVAEEMSLSGRVSQ